MDAIHVGSRIRFHRKRVGWTQMDLCAKLGIQQSDLSRMERGEYRVSLDTLFKLLDIFQLDFGAFLGGEADAVARDEQRLLDGFRSLDEAGRGDLLTHLERLLRRSAGHGVKAG